MLCPSDVAKQCSSQFFLCNERDLALVFRCQSNDFLVQCLYPIRTAGRFSIHILQNQSIRQELLHQLFDFDNRLGIFISPHLLFPAFEHDVVLGVNRLLIDDEYRAKIIRQVKDPFIRAFWAEEYENYDERFKREAIAPIQNKLGQFLLNPVIRNILGQIKKKVDIPFVMDNGRLFIANPSMTGFSRP